MARAMSACAMAGDGIRMSSRAAQRVADVRRWRSAIFTSRAPSASFRRIEPASMTAPQRCRIAAPEADVMAGFGQVGGGGVTAVASAQDCDFHERTPHRSEIDEPPLPSRGVPVHYFSNVYVSIRWNPRIPCRAPGRRAAGARMIRRPRDLARSWAPPGAPPGALARRLASAGQTPTARRPPSRATLRASSTAVSAAACAGRIPLVCWRSPRMARAHAGCSARPRAYVMTVCYSLDLLLPHDPGLHRDLHPAACRRAGLLRRACRQLGIGQVVRMR